MQELTIANINIIIDEVNKAGITFSHLREELVDHICCNVEHEMQMGLTFEKAFEKIRNIADNKGLRKVQESTLLLIDKKYRIMKNTMKIIGWISMTMITVGALFKIQHWPGAGILLVLGFFLLGALFFPSAVWVMKKEAKIKGNLFIYLVSIIGGIIFIFGILFKIQHYPGAGILLIVGFSSIGLLLIPAILISKLRDENAKNLRSSYVIGAIALIFYLAGDLFKIMHYPGASICLIIGAIGLTAIFLPFYSFKVYKNTDSIKASFLFLCVGILFFNMFNILLALNVSKDVLSYFIKPGQELIKTTAILENKSNILSAKIINDTLVKDTLLKGEMKKVKVKSDEFCNYIDNIKTEIISGVDGLSENETSNLLKNLTLIIGKDNTEIPTRVLLGESPDGDKGKASELKSKMELLKTKLLDYCKNDTTAAVIIQKTLGTESPVNTDGNGKKVSWELDNFYHQTTIAAINKLSYFQRNARIAELEALESLKSYVVADAQKVIIKNK